MKGTEKQVAYAKDIITGLRIWAQAQLQSDGPAEELADRIKDYYKREDAERILAEMAFIDAVEAGDYDEAQRLFDGLDRQLAVQSLLDGHEIVAARVIDGYKRQYYMWVQPQR